MAKKINKVFLAPQEVPTDSTDIEHTYVLGGSTRLSGEYSTYGDGEEFILGNQKISSMRIMTGTSRSIYGVLKNALKQVDGGFMIDSRDNGVKIHNHNFGQRTKLAYTYAGGNGELLKANFKTQKKAKPLELTSSSKIDPENKSLDTTVKQNVFDFPSQRLYQAMSHEDIYSRHLDQYWRPDVEHYYDKSFTPEDIQKSIKRGAQYKSGANIVRMKRTTMDAALEKRYLFEKEAKDELSRNHNITADDVKTFLQEVSKRFNDGFEDARSTGNLEPLLKSNAIGNLKVKRTVRVKEWLYPDQMAEKAMEGVTQGRPIGQDREIGLERINNTPSIQVLKTKTKGPSRVVPYKDYDDNVKYKRYDDPVLALVDKEVEVEIEGTRVFAAATPQEIADTFADNALSDASLHQVMCNLTTVGRPEAVSSMVVELNNVSRKYGGRWYTKKVKHTGTASGYTCEMSAIRCGGGLSISTIKSKIHTPSLFNEINKIAKERVAKGNTAGKIRSKVVGDLKTLYTEGIDGKKLEKDVNIGIVVADSVRFYPAKEKTTNIRIARENVRKKQNKK